MASPSPRLETALAINFRRGFFHSYVVVTAGWLTVLVVLLLLYWPTDAIERTYRQGLSEIGRKLTECQENSNRIATERNLNELLRSIGRKQMAEPLDFGVDLDGRRISSSESALSDCWARFEKSIKSSYEEQPFQTLLADIKHTDHLIQVGYLLSAVLLPSILYVSLWFTSTITRTVFAWIWSGFRRSPV